MYPSVHFKFRDLQDPPSSLTILSPLLHPHTDQCACFTRMRSPVSHSHGPSLPLCGVIWRAEPLTRGVPSAALYATAGSEPVHSKHTLKTK